MSLSVEITIRDKYVPWLVPALTVTVWTTSALGHSPFHKC